MRITNKQLRQRIRKILLMEAAVGIDTQNDIIIAKKNVVGGLTEFRLSGLTPIFALENITRSTKGYGQALEDMMRACLVEKGISSATVDLNPDGGGTLDDPGSTADAAFADFIEGTQNSNLTLTNAGNDYLELEGALISAKSTIRDIHIGADAIVSKIPKLLDVILATAEKSKQAKGILIKAGASYATFDAPRSVELQRVVFIVYYDIPEEPNLIFVGDTASGAQIGAIAGGNNPSLLDGPAATKIVRKIFKDLPQPAELLRPGLLGSPRATLTPSIRKVMTVMIALKRLEHAISAEEIFDLLAEFLPGRQVLPITSGTSRSPLTPAQIKSGVNNFLGFITDIITGNVVEKQYSRAGGIKALIEEAPEYFENYGRSMRKEVPGTLNAALENIFTLVTTETLFTGVKASGGSTPLMLEGINVAFPTITAPEDIQAAVTSLNSISGFSNTIALDSNLTPAMLIGGNNGYLLKTIIYPNINNSGMKYTDINTIALNIQKPNTPQSDITTLASSLPATTVQDIITPFTDNVATTSGAVYSTTKDKIPMEDLTSKRVTNWNSFVTTISRNSKTKRGAFRIILDDQPALAPGVASDLTLRALATTIGSSKYRLGGGAAQRPTLTQETGEDLDTAGPDVDAIDEAQTEQYLKVLDRIEAVEDKVVEKPTISDPDYEEKMIAYNKVVTEKKAIAGFGLALLQAGQTGRGFLSFPDAMGVDTENPSMLAQGGELPADLGVITDKQLIDMMDRLEKEKKKRKLTQNNESIDRSSLIEKFIKLLNEQLDHTIQQIDLFNEYIKDINIPASVAYVVGNSVASALNVLEDVYRTISGDLTQQRSTPELIMQPTLPVQSQQIQSGPNENKIYERLLEKLLYTAKKRQ